jgi:4-hydroxy-3-polyprenylbenzoate decarboxylase
MKRQPKKPWIAALTAASGILYGTGVVRALVEAEEDVVLLLSPEARLVVREELGIRLPAAQTAGIVRALFPKAVARRIRFFPSDDLASPPASGSFPAKGMIVCPCSMAAVSAIRTGSSRNLIDRAADVCLKEGRPLILVPREMPLSPIHLENMLALARLGVRILPASPAFYHRPKTVPDLVRFVVGKVLDSARIEHDLYRRWGER